MATDLLMYGVFTLVAIAAATIWLVAKQGAPTLAMPSGKALVSLLAVSAVIIGGPALNTWSRLTRGKPTHLWAEVASWSFIAVSGLGIWLMRRWLRKQDDPQDAASNNGNPES
jgi:hypothetical protein